MTLHVRSRLSALLALAAVAAACDLLVQATASADPGFDHHRSLGWRLLSVVLVAVVPLLAYLPSRVLPVAGGLLGGGTLGNLVWAALHQGTVPNPFVLRSGDGGVAFNLADVCVVCGLALLVVGSIRLAIRHRHRLPSSTPGSRLVGRLVRLFHN